MSLLVIDAHKVRNTVVFGVPGAYQHSYMPKVKIVMLTLEGKFADIMYDVNP